MSTRKTVRGQAAQLARAPRADASAQMKRLTIDISDDLHRAFKQLCAAEGLKIADVARELIGGWVADKKRRRG